MNPDVKVKWLTALRSGEYRKGRGYLITNGGKRHCCLGVLCDLAIKEGVLPDAISPHHTFPGSEVTDWAGIRFPLIRDLAALNDRTADYDAAIAFIEAKF